MEVAPAVDAPVPAGASAPSRRLDAVDVARGSALAAMALFHLTWDLGYLQLVPDNYAMTAAGKWAARGIAGTFLLLAGASLVLARGRSWRAYGGRLARVAGAALAITAATVFLFPQSYIFFGVLHCIAAASVLALPFLRAPPLATLGVAAGVLAAPLALTQAIFDAPVLAFLGLGTRVPDTNDYVPLFPWFGVVLVGVAVARLGLAAGLAERLARWRADAGAARGLARAGRHSLAVYLVHQPLLLALLSGLVALTGPHPRAAENGFRRAYAAECRDTGRAEEVCGGIADCFVAELRAADLWTTVLRPALIADGDRARAIGLLRECYRRGDAAS